MPTGKLQDPAPTSVHGQQLVWGGASPGLQGVTELETPYRCLDKWYLEVQEQCRFGRLSDDNYNFLHGLETTTPGSWTTGAAECGDPRCQQLPDLWREQRNTPWETRRDMECTVCKAERRSRCRVATSAQDPRFQSDKFALAVSVVANNDVKYDTNKKRTLHFAQQSGEGVT